MKRENNQADWIIAIAGVLPVTWFALLMAPFFSEGLMEVIEQFPKAMQHPFRIRLCKDSMKTVLIFCFPMEWVSASISQRRGITDEVRNTVLLSGEIRLALTKSIV